MSQVLGALAVLLVAFNPAFGGHKLNQRTWSTCFAWTNLKKGCTQGLAVDWYLPKADKVSHGVLKLTATKTSSNGYPYTSGMVTTYKSFHFKYGYVSIVAKLPGGNGTWPALWLLPENQTWPPEIDIMENHGSPHQINTTLHWPTPLGDRAAATSVTTRANLVTGYHTYGLRWTADAVTWYLDGKVVDYYSGPNVPHTPMYLLISMAIDGPAKSGSTFDIKSVRIDKNG